MGRIVALVTVLVVAGAGTAVPMARAQHRSAASCSGLSRHVGAHPIVAFGDAATWGVNAAHNCVRSRSAARPVSAHLPGSGDSTYPADLGRRLHATVLDYGVRGESTGGGLKRIAAVLAAAQPTQVLVMEGFADLLRGDSPAVIADRLVLIGQLIESYGATPILLTLYLPAPSRLPGARVRALNTFIRNQGSERGFRVIDLVGIFHGKSHMLTNGLYPSDAGYRVLARAVATRLRAHHA